MVRTSRRRLEVRIRSESAFVVVGGGVLPAGVADSQSATTTREELRSVLNCSLEDMLMTDMVEGWWWKSWRGVGMLEAIVLLGGSYVITPEASTKVQLSYKGAFPGLNLSILSRVLTIWHSGMHFNSFVISYRWSR
jgi:hypothetical protein